MEICIVGIGEIGYANGLYLIDRGIDVSGYDIDPKALKRANEAGIRASNTMPYADVYLVSLPTHYNTIHRVVDKIMFRSPSLISLESTVQPGTCRRLYNLLGMDTHLIHVPHRYWREDTVNYGISQPRVIGGIKEDGIEAGILLYTELGIPVIPVSTIEIAEASKIVENSYRYLQIAYAEELKMICDDTNMDFEELRRACNTKWNIEIMEAREGIEGCLSTSADTHRDTFTGDIIPTAIEVDSKYKRYLK